MFDEITGISAVDAEGAVDTATAYGLMVATNKIATGNGGDLF